MEHYDQADEHKAARQDSGRTTNRSLLGIIWHNHARNQKLL